MRAARRLGRAACALAVAAAAALGVLLVGTALLGWQRYVIVSGSMTGTYDRGSLVLDQVVPTASLRVGDVITYRPPPGAGPRELVTHRIVAIAPGRGGQRVFRTRGDANPVADPWTFTLPRPEQARVRAGIPYAGFAVAALSSRRVRLVVVGLPAALIALVRLTGLWREAGAEAAAEARA
jgi:signal peptidase